MLRTVAAFAMAVLAVLAAEHAPVYAPVYVPAYGGGPGAPRSDTDWSAASRGDWVTPAELPPP